MVCNYKITIISICISSYTNLLLCIHFMYFIIFFHVYMLKYFKDGDFMEEKKELTKELLTISFKELVMRMPFEKITIKMITDGAGVIRPTFYKHFQDKYEVIEYIFKKDIADNIQILIDNNMEEDLFRLMCRCLEKDKTLYKKLFEIKGPNSFEDILDKYVFDQLLFLLNKYPLRHPEKINQMPPDVIARFYSMGISHSLKYWITHNINYTSRQLCDAYDYMKSMSIMDIIDTEHTRK